MPRYINEDDFCEYIRKNTTPSGAEWFISKIKDMPAADVVEVIRCKDCHFYDNQNNGGLKRHGFCEIYKGFKTDDGFCDLGEREETE